MRDGIIIVAITFVLLELGLRALPLVAGDPLRSLVLEAQRIPLSNVRTYTGFSGGTRRLLPAVHDADVVVVGDSVPFGTYVREADTFPSLLAAANNLEIVNLAVGSQTPPEYNRMVELSLPYQPETLLYCIFANDFAYDPDLEVPSLSADRPFGADAVDRDLYLATLDARERAAALLKRISNASVANSIRKLLQQPASTHQSIPWQSGALSFVFAPATYWDPLISLDTPAVREAVTLNARFVNAAQALTVAKGIRLIVILIPSKETVYGPQVGDRIYREAHHQTYRALAAQLQSSGIEAVDVTGALREHAERGEKLFFTIDGHLNEDGHRAVAGALRPILAKR